ncbi:hypothetical protein Aple_000400 [Acrocarpospora pleiomorpha]|uniref:Uncharacterized protein n=1 Tax=Acrocarpospora pleiomorpha TaxID=90975 RepID=A0A5M3X640_9ACTN|nr:hypothetical protein Aple_000400 [Acrocarpospora pleiomorpha]
MLFLREMLAHPALQCLAWSVSPGEIEGAVGQVGGVGPVDGLDERFTGGEVPVQGRGPDVGAPREDVPGDVRAQLGERLAGGRDDVLVVAARVDTHRAPL